MEYENIKRSLGMAELISQAMFMLAVAGSIAIGLGLPAYLWHHPFVLIFLLLYSGFDAIDRAVRPPFNPGLNRDSTPACMLNSALMLALFAAAPFERMHLYGGDPPELVSLVGLFIEFAGLALALGARLQLGRYGTPHLEVIDRHAVIREGLYGRIRHPIYAGGIVSRQAWAIIWGSPIVLVLGATLDVLLISWRIRTEEAMMLDHFGDQYRLYLSETDRLLPGVW
jgi:protein-S-isoprenylcysteine O-methyltransferase Ste14